ncbi:MAG: Gfo/Idh/MocA family oxidoreductase [Candidatus Latescibacteria bacterium]|jgi:predicted dehydrogenase|nr:Gfo/Idh/MocA family oxidoreductase [Candidatus Latescibacterota bacterium]
MALRIAQIGTDGHQNMVLDGIAQIPNAQLVACAKGHESDALAKVKKHAAFTDQTRVYDDYREMLDREEIDLVSICRPYYLNAETSILAAKHGIDIVSEKPIATTLDDLKALEQAVADNNIRLTAMFGMRLSPAFRAAHGAVREGLIGEPILATAQKSYKFGTRANFFKQRETYGGTIPWVAIHAVDYTRWAAGLEYTQVAALHGNFAHPTYPGCEDHGGILFRFANGGTAMVNLDYLRPDTAPTHGDDRLRIAGTEGVIEVTDCGTRTHLIRSGEEPRNLPLPPEENFLVNLHRERTGEADHIVGADDAIAVTRICLLAREAADTGQILTI